ncbi:MAG: hypothetical protein GY798_07255, partial [Hyphomicrobiales bacterium]|nr:hypothetical protein [Hyphomicrobiales bacterium]
MEPTYATIAAEWPELDETTEMANWVLGKRRYDAADVSNHAEMRATAELMCGSLAEGIRGRLIFPA